jgi:hypothetical protein
MAETKNASNVRLGKWKSMPGYSGRGRPTDAFREKYKGSITRSVAMVAEKFKEAAANASETAPTNDLRIKPPGVKWGEVIPEWEGKMGVPTRRLLKKYNFAMPSRWKAPQKPTGRVRIVDGIKVKPPGRKWSEFIPEWKGHKGPAPRYLREKYGFAGPKAEQENKKFSWKNIPEYTGRGMPPDWLLEKYGLPTRRERAETAKPETDAPNDDKKTIMRADGLKTKPKGVKWGEVIPEWKGKMGPPTRVLLEQYGFAPLSTWQEPKKKAPKPELGTQFMKNVIEDVNEDPDVVEALLPAEKPVDLPVEKKAAARNAATARREKRERIEETHHFMSIDSDRRKFNEKMERLRIMAETLEGTGRPEEAKKAWAEIAMIYHSQGLNLLAGSYFQKAGDNEKAAQAFCLCGEYKRADICRKRG